MEDFGKVLSDCRKNKKLSQEDIRRKLRFYGYNLGKSAVSSWETGLSIPNALQFLALCEIYHIPDINKAFLGSPADADTLPMLAGLNDAGRQRVFEYIHLLEKSGEFCREEDAEPDLRCIRKYTISVSAGTGEFLDDSSYDLISVSSEIPSDADFAVQIHGDSMEPSYHNGQTVYVRRTQALNSGDIGIFFLDGQAYCKKLQEGKTGLSLLSLNTDYAPITVGPDSTFRVFGQVIYPLPA